MFKNWYKAIWKHTLTQNKKVTVNLITSSALEVIFYVTTDNDLTNTSIKL